MTTEFCPVLHLNIKLSKSSLTLWCAKAAHWRTSKATSFQVARHDLIFSPSLRPAILCATCSSALVLIMSGTSRTRLCHSWPIERCLHSNTNASQLRPHTRHTRQGKKAWLHLLRTVPHLPRATAVYISREPGKCSISPFRCLIWTWRATITVIFWTGAIGFACICPPADPPKQRIWSHTLKR